MNDIRNNTNFPSSITEHFESLRSVDSKFYFHQQVVIDYVTTQPIRGILIYQSMGSGKSYVAGEICNILIEKGFSVIFFATKTLHENFKLTLDKLQEFTKKPVRKEKYTFIALNASNMFAQVKRETSKFEALLDRKVESKANLRGKVIVIDEAHNFFNAISNGSENAQQLYHAIMQSDCKILFLTGSPIVNDPFEMALCFNMLSGFLEDKTTLFPEEYHEFQDFFILTRDEKDKDGTVRKIKRIKNRSHFANRIVGLVSHYNAGDEVFKKMLPKQLKTKVEFCEMSVSQYNQYTEARKIELDVEPTRYTPQTKKLTKSQGSGSSYRVFSRQLCNFAYPQYALEKTTDAKDRIIYKGNIDKLDPADVVKNISEYSPKIDRFLKNLKTVKGIHLVYSQFLTSGLKIIEIVLTQMGYHKLKIGDSTKAKRFCVITGETPKEEINGLIAILSSKENIDGDVCDIVMVSSTASEGVDFKFIIAVHIFESYWNKVRTSQVIARGVRIGSHIDKPENQRTVQPFIYIATQRTRNKELTSDEHILLKAERNQTLIDSFLSTIRASAVDCTVHKYKDCRLCTPNSKKLFQQSLTIDVQSPDTCESATEVEIEATIVELDGITYAHYEQGDEIVIAKKNKKGDFEIINEPEKTIITNRIFENK